MEKLLPVIFSVLLFLTDNEVKLCEQRSKESFPLLKTFACRTPTSEMTGRVNYPSFSPELDWVEGSFKEGSAISKILMSTALAQLNATVHKGIDDEECYSVFTEGCLYPEFGHENGIAMILQSHLVTTTFPGMSFFSCYLAGREISFSLYFTPYDAATWFATCSTLLLSSFILSVGFYLINKTIYWIEPVLYFFGCLVDEVMELPEKWGNLLPFRLLSIPWLLVGMLISTCYLSIFITNLNSPIPGERVDTYEKISCHDTRQIVESKNSGVLMKKTDVFLALRGDKIENFTNHPVLKGLGGFCYTVLSQFAPRSGVMKYPRHNYKIDIFHIEILYQAYKFPKDLEYLPYLMFNPRIRWYPERVKFLENVTIPRVNGVIEDEILECDKSAFIGESGEVEPYYDYLRRNYPKKKWYRGKNDILTSPIGFSFKVWRESRMMQYFNGFLESGIYNQISNRLTINATILREREAKRGKGKGEGKKGQGHTSYMDVRLEDNIQTVFILLGTCLGVCVLIAGIEYAMYILWSWGLCRFNDKDLIKALT